LSIRYRNLSQLYLLPPFSNIQAFSSSQRN
jgi:hypothetical protein